MWEDSSCIQVPIHIICIYTEVNKAFKTLCTIMDKQTDLYYGSNVINYGDICDTISIAWTPAKIKKPKKKPKRKITLYNVDNILITRKLKIKKKRLERVLSVNTRTCGESSASIVRSASNVCKKEAYYERILPICSRNMCTNNSRCCGSTLNREYGHSNETLSPVSSIASDVFASNNISYEDVSNGSFSSDSEELDNLDTLIKRTKQRDRQINHSYPAREYTSTPVSKIDYIPATSPYSNDTDKKSIHSDTTMVLHPLPEAYSPTAPLDAMETYMENDVYNDMIDINHPFSSTMTPGLIKMGNIGYSPVRTIGDNVPYSPSFTPESIEIDNEPIMQVPSHNMEDDNVPYSTFTPKSIQIVSPAFIKTENFDNTRSNNRNGNETPIITPGMNMKKPNSYNVNTSFSINAYEKFNYSPSSPTVSPDFHKAVTTQMNAKNNPNVAHSSIATMIKQENMDDEATSTNNIYTSWPNGTFLTEDVIKREPCEEYNDHYHSTDTDYNMK